MRAGLGTLRTSFRRRRRLVGASGASGLALALMFLPLRAAHADPAPLVLDGAVPDDGLDHFFLDFTVPDGTKEIAIDHTYAPDTNILDWGLYDQNGYRGWGGGTKEEVVVGELAASRAYVAGPIAPGAWRVVVGKAKVESETSYHVTITFRDAPTLPPFTGRRPYAPAPARKTGTRYYEGDFHCHSLESTDATPTIPAMIDLARSRGLDFIEISDHNTITQIDQLGQYQDALPDFLLVPGFEYTTYHGHANAIGATQWVDHKIGQPGVTIDAAADAVAAQGALFSVNHPMLDLGDLCIGCAWKLDLDPTKIRGVEIETGGRAETGGLFTASSIAFWDALLDKGMKIPAMAGSDDHHAGIQTGAGAESPIGDPTTLVRATELSVAGLLDGIRKGATVVKLQGPGDPMIDFEVAAAKGAPALAWTGDSVGARRVVLRATVTGSAGQTIRLVKNGVPGDEIDVPSDPFVYETIVDAPAAGAGEDRWRVEALVDDAPRTVTSHVWIHFDANGPSAEDAPPAAGCDVAAGDAGSLTPALLALALAFLSVRKRR